jgi:PIN domain nuclease of toxin-antitoxin system
VRLLLDTQVLLWAVASSRRLSRAARTLLEDPDNELFYSAASMWEIAIKSGLRRPDFRVELETLHAALPETGLVELPIRALHAVMLSRLPDVHRDPFDRIVVAQALTEPLVLMTNDEILTRYPAPVRLV